ncbi:hypothetical protein [Lutispora sp.]|uniref:hypothetical protein n=1 Tax=Lutispora sp. TaxID=2828727 RepID=UPI002B2036A1|nr:hypothetical protein [Lutispora sp.]MEA4963330.1 hypothetical protein [Lutispora sp.]
MSIPKKMIMDLVKELPEEKLGKVISFIKFIKQEEEPILVLESEDEEEIAQILVNNEWYSDSEISKMIEDME